MNVKSKVSKRTLTKYNISTFQASDNSGLTVTLANKAMIGIMIELVKLICSNKLHA